MVQQQFAGLPAEVRRLSADFVTQQFQVPRLEQVERQLKLASQQLDTMWNEAADRQVGPQVALLNLLRQLPEMRARAPELSRLISDLSRPSNPPRTERDLTAFDEKLAAAQAQVQGLPELSPGVEAFLRRVAADQATVEDLNKDALRWLQNEGRARLFRIRLAPPRGS